MGKWEGIFQSGKSNGKSHKILENSGNFRQMLFVIFYFYLNELCIISENGSILQFKNKQTKQNIKKYWKMEKKLEKSGNFVIPEKWEQC